MIKLILSLLFITTNAFSLTSGLTSGLTIKKYNLNNPKIKMYIPDYDPSKIINPNKLNKLVGSRSLKSCIQP